MKIEMALFKENEDGSADCSFEVDDEGKAWLFSMGVETMLLKAIEQAKCTPIPAEEPEWEMIDAQAEAVKRAQMFVESNATQLGIFTLRKAYEQGFMAGATWAKERKNAKAS